MEIFKIFVTIMGIAMSLAYYLQAFTIWKNKSAQNVSIPAYIIFSLGTLTWFIYGILLNDRAIFFGYVFGVIGSWTVLILTLIYRHKQ
jgi:uncharacterized protein with PQ loop repeat